MQHHVRLANDPDLECWLAEARLHAMRRLGELSAALPKATGKNLPNATSIDHPGKRADLAAAGIKKTPVRKAGPPQPRGG